jgi:type II secretory pathway component PulC
VHRLRDVNFVLLVLTLALTILLAYQIFGPLEQVSGGVTDNSSKDSDRFPGLQVARGEAFDDADIEGIVEMNLFSAERVPPSGRTKTVSSGEEEGSASYEGYELIGTVLAGGERSFAMIRKGGVRGEIKSYRLRDSVGGMELEEILYDRVLLSKNGKEVVLLLEPREEERKATQPPRARTTKRQPTPKSGQQAPGQQTWTPQQRKDE